MSAKTKSSAGPPKKAAAAPTDDGEPWTTVLRIRRCFAYQVPTQEGHLSLFCEAWGLDSPLFTGELHCLAKSQFLHLRLIADDSSIFADSIWLDCSTANNPIPLEAFIEPAKDSSRYFVIRVGDPGPKPKRVVPIGVGFRERSSAFDLNAAIRDRIHLTQRIGAHADEGEGGDEAKEVEAAEAKLAAAAKDLSLKDGERIRVKLKAKKKGGDNPLGLFEDEEEEEGGGEKREKGGVKAPGIAMVEKGGSLLLAPPPSLESSVKELEEREKGEKKKGAKKKGKKEETPPPPPVVDEDDEFGDFASA